MKEIIPIRFDGYMRSGGSTKPWRVVAIAAESGDLTEIAYVVKTFTANQVNQAHSIGKEFICNALAKQFELQVPDAAIINLHNDDFCATLDQESLNVLHSKLNDNTYASKLLSNTTIINEEAQISSFSIHDCASLFAFDCFIMNSDRGGYRNKPNLLVDDDGFYLIDHELTFPFIDAPAENAFNRVMQIFNDNLWPELYQKHLFYPRLKNYGGSKKGLFDTFEELIRNLNVNHVEQLIAKLNNRGVSTGNNELLIAYLSTLKQKSGKFRSILLGLIS